MSRTSTLKRARDGEDNIVTSKRAKSEATASQMLANTIFDRYLEHHTFLAGPSQTSFVIHKAVLIDRGLDRTKLFLNSYAKFEEDQGRLDYAYISDAAGKSTENAFRVFVTWLHTEQLVPLPTSDSPTACNVDESPDAKDVRLVIDMAIDNDVREAEGVFADIDLYHMFELGRHSSARAFRNAAMSALVVQNDALQQTTSQDVIDELCYSAIPSASFRKYLAEEASRRLKGKSLADTADEFPPQYLADVLDRVLAEHQEPAEALSLKQWRSRVCEIGHHHTGDEQKARCVKAFKKLKRLPYPSPLIHNSYSSTAIIQVGSESVEVLVHEGLICKESGFFRGALQGNFSESSKKTVPLQQESVKNFALFTHWLYTKEIQLPTFEEHQRYCAYTLALSQKASMQVHQTAADRASAFNQGTNVGQQRSTEPSEISPSEQPDSAYASIMSDGQEHQRGQITNESDAAQHSVVTVEHGCDPGNNELHAARDKANADLDVDEEAEVEVSEDAELDDAEDDDDDDVSDQDEGDDDSGSEETDREAKSRWQDDLVDLFIFADRRDIPGLRNDVMSRLITARELGWPLLCTVDRINVAYASLPPSSALCEYLVEEAAWCWDRDSEQNCHFELLPPDFTAKVLRHMLNQPKCSSRPWWRTYICHYHQHSSDAEQTECHAKRLCWHRRIDAKGPVMEPVET